MVNNFNSPKPQTAVLIVEDDLTLSKLLAYSIQKLDYHPICAYSAEEALRLLDTHSIDLILLDIVLPEMDGFELCEIIRQSSDIPIITLSSISGSANIVKMLEVGADDYITKPCQFALVEAMIVAQMRRSEWNNGRGWQSDQPLTAGTVSLDVTNQTAIFNRTKVRLSIRECNILECLIRKPDQPLSISKIYEEIWGECNGQEKNIVPTLIRRLRTKIERDPTLPDFIVNVRGYGYKLATSAPMALAGQ